MEPASESLFTENGPDFDGVETIELEGRLYAISRAGDEEYGPRPEVGLPVVYMGSPRPTPIPGDAWINWEVPPRPSRQLHINMNNTTAEELKQLKLSTGKTYTELVAEAIGLYSLLHNGAKGTSHS